MANNRYLVDKNTFRESQLIFGGLIGIAVVATIQMIGQSDLDVALSVSIHSFAVSIPFLCSLIYTGYYEIRFKYTSNPAFLTLAEIIGIGGAMLGILALFWHFSWVAGSTFLVCSVLASVYAAWFSSIVEALNEEKTERN